MAAMKRRDLLQTLGIVLFLLLLAPRATAQCLPPFWDSFVGDPGIEGNVFALAVFDAGPGNSIYAGGDFTTAGNGAASRIASWDGQEWLPLGSGVDNGAVRSLVVFDDGTGPALYVGGQFNIAGGMSVDRMARWDGSTWSDVGGGVSGAIVDALAVFDDGSGAALYAAGSFSSAGGVPVQNIARWDGVAWSDVGGGLDATTLALAVHDDSSGTALHAGGFFSAAGGQPASFVARWDGAQWAALATGTDNAVWSLASYDDGAGSDLYVGGDFLNAGGSPAAHVARWDGSTWSPVGSGVNGTVFALQVFDGTLPGLHAGGSFTSAGGAPAQRIARWNGSAWSPLAGGADGDVRALAVHDDLSTAGESLYAAGLFTTVDGQPVEHISRWIPCPEGLPQFFIRGDVDGSGFFNGLIDGLFLLAFQFSGGPVPPCLEAADGDGNDIVNGLVDALYLLNAQFSGGAPPPPPFPDCGTDDNYTLGCDVVPDLCW